MDTDKRGFLFAPSAQISVYIGVNPWFILFRLIFGALLIMFPFFSIFPSIARAAPQEGLLGYREAAIQTPRYRL